MEYKKLSVNGISYGELQTMTKEDINSKNKVTNVDF